MISGQLKEKIINDIFKKLNTIPTKTSGHSWANSVSLISSKSYDNFINFLANSFQYKLFDDKKINIVDFIHSIDLEDIYNFFQKSNTFTCFLPQLQLFYLSDSHISIETKHVLAQKVNNIFDIYNPNDILVLYTINGDIIRYAKIENDPGYIQFNSKERLRKERLEKLERINEVD